MLVDNWSGVARGDAGRLAGRPRVLAALVDRVEATPMRHGAAHASPATRARHATQLSLTIPRCM